MRRTENTIQEKETTIAQIIFISPQKTNCSGSIIKVSRTLVSLKVVFIGSTTHTQANSEWRKQKLSTVQEPLSS